MFRSIARLAWLPLGVGLVEGSPARAQTRDMVLATTTSTQDSGLLDSLLPAFRAASGIEVKVVAVGSGAALAMARSGAADAVLVHAPEAERPYVESGDLVDGRRIMHNDFLIVGPATDPARAAAAEGLAGALRSIATAGPFISRGDGSGTHSRELELWKLAGVEPATVNRREETGQGMGATLVVASERRGYTLTDRGTYLVLRRGLDLIPLVEGYPALLNVYHAYVVNPSKHRKVKSDEARALVEFLTSEPAQTMIRGFGESQFGQPLFFPDADKGLP